MMENDRPKKVEINNWTFRIRHPKTENDRTRVLLLLHGHLGNENAMWILTKPLPKSYFMLAPRAPLKTGPDQYSWHKIGPQRPDIEVYRDIANQLLSSVDSWADNNQLDVEQYDLMGFSQGAVLAYALALLHPKKAGNIAALAGFIPQSWKDYINRDAIADKNFYIAHGIQDEMVPIKKARQAEAWLKEKGARVTFCEADTGHKLSANCFNGLGEFFN